MASVLPTSRSGVWERKLAALDAPAPPCTTDAFTQHAPLLSWLLYLLFGFHVGAVEGVACRPLSALLVPCIVGTALVLLALYDVADGVWAAHLVTLLLCAMAPTMLLPLRVLQPVLEKAIRPPQLLPKALQCYAARIRQLGWLLSGLVTLIVVGLTGAALLFALPVFPKYSLFIKVTTVFSWCATGITSTAAVVVLVTWHLVALLHEVQLEVLLRALKHRVRSALLESPPPPALPPYKRPFARCIYALRGVVQEVDLLGAGAPLVLQATNSIHNQHLSLHALQGYMSIDVILLSYRNTRRSIDLSSELLGSVLGLCIYIAVCCIVASTMSSFNHGASSSTVHAFFPLIIPFFVILGLLPPSRLNAWWALHLQDFLFDMSLYNQDELLRIQSLLTMYPISLKVLRLTVTGPVLTAVVLALFLVTGAVAYFTLTRTLSQLP
jgi:hypothetical protein